MNDELTRRLSAATKTLALLDEVDAPSAPPLPPPARELLDHLRDAHTTLTTVIVPRGKLREIDVLLCVIEAGLKSLLTPMVGDEDNMAREPAAAERKLRRARAGVKRLRRDHEARHRATATSVLILGRDRRCRPRERRERTHTARSSSSADSGDGGSGPPPACELAPTTGWWSA